MVNDMMCNCCYLAVDNILDVQNHPGDYLPSSSGSNQAGDKSI